MKYSAGFIQVRVNGQWNGAEWGPGSGCSWVTAGAIKKDMGGKTSLCLLLPSAELKNQWIKFL